MFQLSVVFVMMVLYRHTTVKTLPEITFKVSTNTIKQTLTNVENIHLKCNNIDKTEQILKNNKWNFPNHLKVQPLIRQIFTKYSVIK